MPHSVKPVMTQSHVRKKSPMANLEFIIDDQLRDELRLEIKVSPCAFQCEIPQERTNPNI